MKPMRELFEGLGPLEVGDLAAELVADRADEDDFIDGYGAFKGGDPRTFDPDTEVCTAEELEAHRVACLEANAMEARGEVPDWPSSHGWVHHDGVVMHVTAAGFGLGIYQQGVSNV